MKFLKCIQWFRALFLNAQYFRHEQQQNVGYWQIPLWIYCWNLYHLHTNMRTQLFYPCLFSETINMQVQRRKMMSSQLITFAFMHKSLFLTGVSSNRVHMPACSALYPSYIGARRDGPGRGGFLNWMLVSGEVSSVHVNGVAVLFPRHSVLVHNVKRRPAKGKRTWQADESNMRWWTWSVSEFATESYFHFVELSSFSYRSFFSFSFLFFWTQRNRLSAISGDGARRKIASMQRSQTKGASSVYFNILCHKLHIMYASDALFSICLIFFSCE